VRSLRPPFPGPKEPHKTGSASGACAKSDILKYVMLASHNFAKQAGQLPAFQATARLAPARLESRPITTSFTFHGSGLETLAFLRIVSQ
jgi:hypothetical protein